MTTIKPFDPTVPAAEVERLYRKLRDTRLPQYPIVPDARDNDDYGAPFDWAHQLYTYWAEQYDWDAAQKQINSWHHFTAEIESLRIHFIHEKSRPASKNRRVIPLLLVHGWPGSFYEFSQVIGPLVSGLPDDKDMPVFDVVVPSLPGYAWSSPPPRRGWTLQDTARVFDELMRRLGYHDAGYCVQGGDWGHWVLRELGSGCFPACKAVHTNMCAAVPPVPESKYTEREKMAQERNAWFLGRPGRETHMGYAVEMRTRPQTLGIALSDNPVGIMMWVGEKYNEISDPSLANLQSQEYNAHVMTTVCLYYFTSPSIMTSMLCYYENVRHEDYVAFNQKPENLVKMPMGCTSFRWDISPMSARAMETTGNLQWFKERGAGGHFAALETPTKLVEDLRACFRKLYQDVHVRV